MRSTDTDTRRRRKSPSISNQNEQGCYRIPADGGKYWTIGTSKGKFGEFAKFGDVFLSVNSAGRVWAKVGTPKAEAFIAMVNRMIEKMKETNAERIAYLDSLDEEEEDD